MSDYNANRRCSRGHSRVVRNGSALFDADGIKQEPGDAQTIEQRAKDDDNRILGELPPHWAVFSERGR